MGRSYKVFLILPAATHVHACKRLQTSTLENAIMNALSNKTALVTGASRGMGRAAALALAAEGARVVVHYGRNADEAKAVVDQIRTAGGQADAVAADLAAPDGAHKLAAQVRDLVGERLDILVAHARLPPAAAIAHHNPPGFRHN